MSDSKILFDKLHQDYSPMVMQMCLGFVNGNKILAEDLAQNIFINIWKALERFKSNSSYKTWIYRITVNTCLKYLRDNKQPMNLPIESLPEPISAEADEHQYQSLYSAIGQLAEIDRLIIMMVLDELKYEEIANIIGISEGNLRVKIHRIKATLKKILSND